jgi:hypothetical protein
MQQQRNTEKHPSSTGHEPRIIPIHRPQTSSDIEFEQQLSSLRSMISKLRPESRQQYFDAFLDYLLSIEVEYPKSSSGTSSRKRAANLSLEERALIKELSETVQQLHDEADRMD